MRYMDMYMICFIATTLQIILILLIGSEKKKQKQKPRKWIGMILKACVVAAVLSFAAPVLLVIYAVIWALIGISFIEGE